MANARTAEEAMHLNPQVLDSAVALENSRSQLRRELILALRPEDLKHIADLRAAENRRGAEQEAAHLRSLAELLRHHQR
jgi:hypothetical protein